jgi:hypothetical protein
MQCTIQDGTWQEIGERVRIDNGKKSNKKWSKFGTNVSFFLFFSRINSNCCTCFCVVAFLKLRPSLFPNSSREYTVITIIMKMGNHN